MAISHPHGLFSWTDISLPDPQAGKRFYTALFGWDAEDQVDPEGNYVYTMFGKGGRAVAGLGPMPPGMDSQGIPPMWQSYASVDDVDAVVAKVGEHGGSVIMPAMDVFTSGRMAVVADPQGAVFSLWQAGDHPGGETFNNHGELTWNELATRDTEGAKAFYAAILGWDFERFEGPSEYWLIKVEGKSKGALHQNDDYNGGIMAMDENWPADLPAHWMVYFNVDDTDAAVAKLEALGGKLSVPAFDSPAGRIAVVGDDQGGTFSVIQVPVQS